MFIFVLHLGVRGAAIATVLSQIASCLYVLHILFGKTIPIRITFGGYSFAIMKRILTVGFTPFLIIAIDNVMIIAMNLPSCSGMHRRTRRQLHHLCNDRSELYADYYDTARRNQQAERSQSSLTIMELEIPGVFLRHRKPSSHSVPDLRP